MPKTFTLRRLFAVLTMACVVSGLAAAFPHEAVLMGLSAGLLIPAIVVTWTFFWLSSRRVLVLVAGYVAAFAGFVGGVMSASSLFEVLFEVRAFNSLPTAWDSYFVLWVRVAGCSSLAAAAACVLTKQFTGKASCDPVEQLRVPKRWIEP